MYVRTQDGDPWDHLKRLGTVIQGKSELIVCMNKDEPQSMSMVKELSRAGGGLKEANLLRKLSHPNIVKMIEVFLQDDDVYIELEYCRFTLEEVLSVHVRFEEPHIRLIAQSVLLFPFALLNRT